MSNNPAIFFGTSKIIAPITCTYSSGIKFPHPVNLRLAHALLLVKLYEEEDNEFHLADNYERETASEYMQKIHQNLLGTENEISGGGPYFEISLDSINMLDACEVQALSTLQEKISLFVNDGMDTLNILLDFYMNLHKDDVHFILPENPQNMHLAQLLQSIELYAVCEPEKFTEFDLITLNETFNTFFPDSKPNA